MPLRLSEPPVVRSWSMASGTVPAQPAASSRGEPIHWKPSARVPCLRMSMVTTWPIRLRASGVSATSLAVTVKVTRLSDIGRTSFRPDRSMVEPVSSRTVLAELMLASAAGATISAPDCMSTLPKALIEMFGWIFWVKAVGVATLLGVVPDVSSGVMAMTLWPPRMILPLAPAFRVDRLMDPGRVIEVVTPIEPNWSISLPSRLTLPSLDCSTAPVSLVTTPPVVSEAKAVFRLMLLMPVGLLPGWTFCTAMATWVPVAVEVGSVRTTPEPAARMIWPSVVVMAPWLVTEVPSRATKPPSPLLSVSVVISAPFWTVTPPASCPFALPGENITEPPENRPFCRKLRLEASSPAGAWKPRPLSA